MTTLTQANAATAYSERIDCYFYLAAIALLAYDHLLTLKSEVRYIWTSGHIKASAWYLVVRYLALAGTVTMFVLSLGNFSAKSCVELRNAHSLLFVAQEVLIEITLILRVLAMYSLNKRVMSAIAGVVLVGVSLAIWSIVESTPGGCNTTPSTFRSIWMAGLWEGLLATDIIFLGLTVYRGYSQCRDGFGLPRGSLWRVLVRDGVIYYIIICSANLANILAYYVLGNVDISGGLSTFTVALSVSMVCRLTLNLHEVVSEPNDLMVSELVSIQFARSPKPEEAD
ncbi:hypothetical protein K438DRAFT_1847292 [Mycena galopus ATCC 62051]|nr:hypothetical protein K438DRAFT_1847292 [Mycena galopus ATCC 62051]